MRAVIDDANRGDPAAVASVRAVGDWLGIGVANLVNLFNPGMVVFGGMASLVGSVVGAVILTLLPQYLTTFSEYEWVIYGLILMLVMIFMPKGLVPTLLERLQRRKS